MSVLSLLRSNSISHYTMVLVLVSVFTSYWLHANCQVAVAAFPQTATPRVTIQPEKEQVPVGPTARGRVFVDTNNDGLFSTGEQPLKGVRVSNGLDIVATDGDGNYSLSMTDDGVVFVIKPAGYRTRLSSDNLPRFYYLHKPNGSPKLQFAGVEPTGPLPKAIDFPLYPQVEPTEFRMVLFGDPHPGQGSWPVAAGLTPANVRVDWIETGAGAPPTAVRISIVGYHVDAVFGAMSLDGRPDVQFPFLGQYAPTGKEQ